MARIRPDVRYELRSGEAILGAVTITRSEGNWLVATFEPTPVYEEHRLLFQEQEEAILRKWKARLDDFERRIEELALHLVTPDGKQRVPSLRRVRIDGGTLRIRRDRTADPAIIGVCIPCERVREALYDLRDGELTITLAHEAIKAGPDHQAARMYLSHALHWLKRHEEDRKALEEGIVALPKDPQLRAMLARSLRMLGKPRKAVKAAKAGLELKPGDPDSVEELALAWVDRRYPKEAREVLRGGLALNPGHVALTHALALQHMDGPENLRIAEGLYRGLITPEYRDWRTFNGLGSALEFQGKVRTAIIAYEIAAILDPEEALPEENLARARAKLPARDGDEEPELDAQLAPIHSRLTR